MSSTGAHRQELAHRRRSPRKMQRLTWKERPGNGPAIAQPCISTTHMRVASLAISSPRCTCAKWLKACQKGALHRVRPEPSRKA